MSTPKQIAANRLNALKSTGPISVEGKKQSRRNALKHGLAGAGLVLPCEESTAVERRIAEWHSSLKPFDNYETWLLEVVAVESIRVDLCRVQDRVLREEQIRRAGESWADDQRQAALELAARLAKNPAVAAKLRKTVAGASILLERWQLLSRALANGGWSEAQDELAYDLLGTPIGLREGAASPLNSTLVGDTLAHRLGLVRGQIAELERLIFEVLPAKEEDKRALIQAGMPDLEDRALMRLHRYESRCFRRLMWASSKMRSTHKGGTTMPEPTRATILPKPAVESLAPVYRRPLLQHLLDKKAAKSLAKRIEEKQHKAEEPARKKDRPKPLVQCQP